MSNMNVGCTINLCLQSPVSFFKYAYMRILELVTNVTGEYKALYLRLRVRNENIVYSAVTFIYKQTEEWQATACNPAQLLL